MDHTIIQILELFSVAVWQLLKASATDAPFSTLHLALIWDWKAQTPGLFAIQKLSLLLPLIKKPGMNEDKH